MLMGLISFAFGCGGNGPYHKKDGHWYWKDDQMDAKSSERLTRLNDVFATVGDRAYYRGDAIFGSDAATFQALDERYAKDAKQVYFCDTFRKDIEYWLVKRGRTRTIDGADAATFRLLEQRYARDTARIYFQGEPFEVKDAASFEILYSSFARDRTTGYYQLKPVPDSDGPSFEGLNDNYARDRSHVWYSRVETDGGAHPGEARNTLLADAHPASFTVLDHWYAKDRAHVYYRGKEIPGADAATFAMLPAPENGVEARDANAGYAEGKRVK